MSNLLRVCVYAPDPERSEDLLTQIKALNFVRIAGVLASEDELAQTLQAGGINLIFFHLDADPVGVVEVIENVATRFPELALIAVSHNTGPEAILAPMRAGCDQFVCEPIDHADLASAVARAASKRALVTTSSRCICVTGASGGVGSTAIAANLALEIGAITERECALVDLDFQFGDLALVFDCVPRRTFYDLAAAEAEVDQSLLRGLIADVGENVVLLARPNHIPHCVHLTPDVVRAALDGLGSVFENVVIDVPRSIDEVTITAMGMADKILIVTQLLVPSIRNAKRYFDALVEQGIQPEKIEVLVNRATSAKTRVGPKDLEEAINKPPYAILPNDYEYVAQAIDFGQPIASNDRRHPIRAALHDLAARLTGQEGAGDGASRGKKGLFGRMLSR